MLDFMQLVYYKGVPQSSKLARESILSCDSDNVEIVIFLHLTLFSVMNASMKSPNKKAPLTMTSALSLLYKWKLFVNFVSFLGHVGRKSRYLRAKAD